MVDSNGCRASMRLLSSRSVHFRLEIGSRRWPGVRRVPLRPAKGSPHALLALRAARPAPQNRGITPILTAPEAVGRLKVREMITSPVPSCPVPSWSRSVSRRGDRLPVRQARPPGTAGRCRGGTSTYLPHVNVPFSHPSGGRAQKDGRKVRWCCQGTFTLGRSPRPASSTRHGPPGGARRAHPLSR